MLYAYMLVSMGCINYTDIFYRHTCHLISQQHSITEHLSNNQPRNLHLAPPQSQGCRHPNTTMKALLLLVVAVSFNLRGRGTLQFVVVVLLGCMAISALGAGYQEHS